MISFPYGLSQNHKEISCKLHRVTKDFIGYFNNDNKQGFFNTGLFLHYLHSAPFTQS